MCAVEWKKLGSLCEIRGRIGFRGYTREDQVVKGEGAISLSPANIVDSRLCYDDSTYISWSKYNESPEIMVFNDDLIFCKTASVGKVSMVENLPCEATINPQLVVLKNICVNSKYLYYCLCGNKVQDEVKAMAGVGSVPNVSQTKLANILIPIPSLAKQQEIVSHLDTFTTLISNLESELDMRRKQYEHYRNQLLDFEGVEGVEWKTLGENIAILRGKRLTKNELLEDGRFPVYHGGLEALGFYDKKNREKDTVMVINVGASAGTVGYCACDFWSSDGCFCLSKNDCLYSKFLYNLLKIREHLISSKVRKAGIPTLDSKVIEDLIIPIVDIKTQQEIVEKLDAFEQLIQSLEQEIKLRKQQYEYYREKLLTFE